MKSLIALVVLAASVHSQGHVLTVDAAGGGAYTQIGAAVQHASAGDVVLVNSGSYQGFTVANQSVAIVGDAYATVQINGTVQVRNLAAGRRVLLHRLRAFGATSVSANDGPGITLKNDSGAVRVQDCLAQGAAGLPGVRVEGSGDVALASSQPIGGVGWEFSGHGVLFNGGAIALYDCDVVGADGAPPWSYTPPGCRGGSAGSGLRSSMGGFIFCGGSLLHGGSGQDGMWGCWGGSYYGDCAYGGNAGNGIDVRTGVQAVWLLGNAYQIGSAGQGGYGQCGCGLLANCDCDPGNPGGNLASDSGDTVLSLAGASPTLTLGTNPSRESTWVSIAVESAPQDAVLLIASSATSFSPETDRGVRLVDSSAPYFTQRLGTADAQGHLQSGWSIPDLGPGVESQIVHLQLLVVHTNGQRRWSNPVSLVLLDSAF